MINRLEWEECPQCEEKRKETKYKYDLCDAHMKELQEGVSELERLGYDGDVVVDDIPCTLKR